MSPQEKAFASLVATALRLPGATEHHPWGETAIKVKGKVFVFLYLGSEGLALTAKLPQTGGVAMMLPFAEPTGYGLGKSGWVTARFRPKEKPPVPLLEEWIAESYAAIAPAKKRARRAGR